jgi:hypothetical protein
MVIQFMIHKLDPTYPNHPTSECSDYPDTIGFDKRGNFAQKAYEVSMFHTKCTGMYIFKHSSITK